MARCRIGNKPMIWINDYQASLTRRPCAAKPDAVIHSLKRKCHFDEIFVTGYIEKLQLRRCSQWRNFVKMAFPFQCFGYNKSASFEIRTHFWYAWNIIFSWFVVHQGPLLLTWINLNPSMISNHMPSVKCVMKLLIHSQSSTVQPMEFRNRYVISSHTL